MLRKLSVLFVLLLLSGCSSLLSPVPATSKQTYLLADPISNHVPQNALTGVTLLVSQPTAPGWLDDTRMVYEQQPNQISYFALNEWASSPALLLQPIVVHALQQSGHYRAVIAAPFEGNSDQRLDLRLLSMQQNFWQKPSFYQMTLQAQLMDNKTQQILATQRFSATAIAPSDTPQGGVTAANQAVAQITVQLAQFCRRY